VVEPAGLGKEAVRADGPRVEISFATPKDAVVGFDVRVDPPGAPLKWELFLDEAPWPEGYVFAGPFGLAAPQVRGGLTSDDARARAFAPRPPEIDPARDLGLFVTRARRAELLVPERESSGEGALEMTRILREWGYAHTGGDAKPGVVKRPTGSPGSQP
jgi:hypothetical protein